MCPGIFSGCTRESALHVPLYILWMYPGISSRVWTLDVPVYLPGYDQHTQMGYRGTYSGYTLANTPFEGCTSCRVGGCGRSTRMNVAGLGCDRLTDWTFVVLFCLPPVSPVVAFVSSLLLALDYHLLFSCLRFFFSVFPSLRGGEGGRREEGGGERWREGGKERRMQAGKVGGREG